MLAVECLCNLSLGSESDCEKIAQFIGSYLHTFLQSSNESLAVSLTNIKIMVIDINVLSFCYRGLRYGVSPI